MHVIVPGLALLALGTIVFGSIQFSARYLVEYRVGDPLYAVLWLALVLIFHRALRSGEIGFRSWQASAFNAPRNVFSRKDKPGLYWLSVGVALICIVCIRLGFIRKYW